MKNTSYVDFGYFHCLLKRYHINLKNAHLGLVGEREIILEQLKLIVAQMTFQQSYHDLQIVLIHDKKYNDEFRWMRWYPHLTIKIYVDMKWKKEEGDCKNPLKHKFGMGAIQWTNTRGEELLEFYLREAGCDTESAEFQTMVQNCLQNKPYGEVYLTANQAWIAEMKMMIYELTEDKDYEEVYPSYKRIRGEDTLENIKSAAEIVRTKYIKNGSLPERKAAALRWYMEQYGNDVE